MSLLALQRDMRAWLVAEDESAAARLGAAALPGLRVYGNTYRAQLVDCLEASFARTRAWIGDAAFLSAAAHHIDRQPPSSWTLDAYAHDFPLTLHMLHPQDPEIAGIARIELALEEAFVAADCLALDAAGLGDVHWDRAILCVAPAVELVEVAGNAFAILSALVDERPPPPADSAHTATALVWRQDHRVRTRLLDAAEQQALLQVRAGMSFGELCSDAAATWGQEAGTERVGQWLGRWIADGLIVGVDQAEA